MLSKAEILNARILIVEDNQANVDLLEMIIRNAGYSSILSITDPRQAEETYFSYRPDIVLLDINMPHLDGYQVLSIFKKIEEDNYLPVLVLTAQQDEDTRIKSLSSGAQDFLTKPFNKTETLNRINNILSVRLLHNQVRDQNLILERKVHERTKELERTRLDVIRRLGRAAEYRDNETGMHIIRMSKTCELLGQKLGLSRERCFLLLHASPMHDIGKIGIPDNILLKPGKLEDEEWAIMKKHPEIGAELLVDDKSRIMEMAHTIALTHHEKYNGTGYPGGLKGEEIPIEGRIAAVADVFDALTSVRPYKKAWDVDMAVDLIKEEKGQHFDPDVVDVFLEILPEVLEIKEKYSDSMEYKDIQD